MTRQFRIPQRCAVVLLLFLSAVQFASGQRASEECGKLVTLNWRELIARDREIFAAQLRSDWPFLARQTSPHPFYEIDERGPHVRWPASESAPAKVATTTIPRLSIYAVRTYGNLALVLGRVGAHTGRDGQAVASGLRRVGIYLWATHRWNFMGSLMEPAPAGMGRVDAAGDLAKEKERLHRLNQEWSVRGVTSDALDRILAADVFDDIEGDVGLTTADDRRRDEEKQFYGVRDRANNIQTLTRFLSEWGRVPGSLIIGTSVNYRIDVYGDKLAVVSTEVLNAARDPDRVRLWRTPRAHVYVKDTDWRLILYSWSNDPSPGSCVVYDPRTPEEKRRQAEDKRRRDEETANAQRELAERQQKTSRAFNELEKHTEVITSQAESLFGPQSAAAGPILTQMKGDIAFLEGRGADNEFNLADEIIDVLFSEATLLERVGSREFSPDKAFVLTDATAKSLHVQRLSCEQDVNGWMNVIPIEIITKKNGVQVTDYQAFLLPEGEFLAGTTAHLRRFDSLTPVRDVQIAPGKWIYWAEKDGQSSTRQGPLVALDSNKISVQIEVH